MTVDARPLSQPGLHLSDYPLLVAVAATIWVPYQLIAWGLGAVLGVSGRLHADNATAGRVVLYAIVVGLLSTVALALSQAVLTRAVGDRLDGSRSTFADTWRRGAEHWVPILVATILLAALILIVEGLIGGVGLLLAALLRNFAPLVLLLVAMLLILAPIVVAARFAVYPQLIVLEGARARDSLVRSWELIRPRYLVALGLTVLLALAGWLLSVALSAFGPLGAVVAACLFAPVPPICFTLLLRSLSRDRRRIVPEL